MISKPEEVLQSIVNTAQIHAKRVRYAMSKLAPYFPLSGEAVLAIKEDELALFEFYTARFGKLQDLMGSALFPALLAVVGDFREEMTFMDRLNRLEKLGVINKAQDWIEMRQIRNHLVHEYPDNPEVTAEYLNQAFRWGDELLNYLNRAIQFLNTHTSLTVI